MPYQPISPAKQLRQKNNHAKPQTPNKLVRPAVFGGVINSLSKLFLLRAIMSFLFAVGLYVFILRQYLLNIAPIRDIPG
jgi:hypothetical protein